MMTSGVMLTRRDDEYETPMRVIYRIDGSSTEILKVYRDDCPYGLVELSLTDEEEERIEREIGGR